MRRMNLLDGVPVNPDNPKGRLRGRWPVVIGGVSVVIWGTVGYLHIQGLDSEIAVRQERVAESQRHAKEHAQLKQTHDELTKRLEVFEGLSVGIPAELTIALLGRTLSESVVINRILLTESSSVKGRSVSTGGRTPDYEGRFEGLAVDGTALTDVVHRLSNSELLRDVRLVESDVSRKAADSSRRFTITAGIVLPYREASGTIP